MFRRLIARISESHTRWIAWGMVMGMLSGLSAALFFVALEYATHLTIHDLALSAPPATPGDALFAPDHAPDTEPRLHHTAKLWAGVATSHHEPVADRLSRQNNAAVAAFTKRNVGHRDRPDRRAGQGGGQPATPFPHATRPVL